MSPNFPIQYENNAQCVWIITASNPNKVSLHFDPVTVKLSSLAFGVCCIKKINSEERPTQCKANISNDISGSLQRLHGNLWPVHLHAQTDFLIKQFI